MSFFIEKDEKLVINPKMKPWLIFLGVISIIFFNIFGIFIVTVTIVVVRATLKHANFMRQFAIDNNLFYVKDKEYVSKMPQNLTARLFSRGHSRKVSHYMKGKIQDFDTSLFNYNYTVGSGKNSHTYSFTICEINFEKTKFPYIFLKSKKMWANYSIMISSAKKETQIKLEKTYDKYFKLYCTEDYEIEVLQIFTKDLLDYLIEHGNKFSIEFHENKIYIYDDRILRKENEMDEIFTVMQKIIKNSGGLLNRLHDDFEAMRNSYDR